MKKYNSILLRRVGVVLPVLTIIFLQILVGSSFVVVASSTPSVRLKHSIVIKTGGLVVVNDTITLLNNRSETISSFQVGILKGFVSYLDEMRAIGQSESELGITKNVTVGGDRIYWMNISFGSDAVSEGETYRFSVIYAFSGLVTNATADATVYGAIFPKYPALSIDAESCEVTVSLPSGVALQGSSWDSLPYVEEPLKAYSNEVGYVTFNGTMQLINSDSLERGIVLDAYGNAVFTDTYQVRNIGMSDFSSVDLKVLKESSDIEVYDPYGPLSFTIKDGDSTKTVTVTFRYTLRGEKSGTIYHDASSVTLKYKVKMQPFLAQESWDTYRFNTKLFTGVEWTIKEIGIRITLPEGGEFIQGPAADYSLSKTAFTQSIMLSLQQITPIHSFDLTVRYKYSVFWSAFRPTLVIGVMCVAVFLFMLSRKRRIVRPVVSKAVSRESADLVRIFVESYEEKLSLWNEARTLDRDLEDGRIRKKDYNRRKGIVEQRRHSVDRELLNLKEQLKHIGARYSELISRIDSAEAEVKSLESNINTVVTQHRSGKLSRNAYEKLRDGYEKKLDKTKGIIEGTIIELKGED